MRQPRCEGGPYTSILGRGEISRTLADEQFPGATQIVDLYHAKGHLSEVATALYGPGTDLARHWAQHRHAELDAGRLAALLAALRPHRTTTPQARTCYEYVRRNRHRMRYPQFRAQGLCVASGVVEAGCQVVAGSAPLEHWLATPVEKAAVLPLTPDMSPSDGLPIGLQSDGRIVLLDLAPEPWPDAFRRFLRAHAPLLPSLPLWTLRIVLPPRFARAYDDYQRAVHEELESPLPAAGARLQGGRHQAVARTAEVQPAGVRPPPPHDGVDSAEVGAGRHAARRACP